MRLTTHLHIVYTDLSAARGSVVEVVEDAGDYNRDGFRDVLAVLDHPDAVGRHRRQYLVFLGGRSLRTSTLTRAVATGRVLRVTGPNPPLPVHVSQIPASDADGDGWRDDASLDTDEVVDTYPCGGDTPSCMAWYHATRLTVRSNAELAQSSGPLVFSYGSPWFEFRPGPYQFAATYGWLGDWTGDRRADLFVADPSGVTIFAFTRAGLRRMDIPIQAPDADRPYLPIALDVTGDHRPELIGAQIQRERLQLVFISPA